MKKLFLLLFLIAFYSTRADVYIVNNQMEEDTEKKIYTTLLTAHDAASSGDTIYVEGSSKRYYENVVISKKLYIIGPGYFPGENLSIQVNSYAAEFSSIKISEGGTGTKLEGISTYNNIDLHANNVTITHCKTGIDIEKDISNLSVTKCYLSSLYGGSAIIDNLVMSNCILKGSLSLQDGSSGILINNIILYHVYFRTGFTVKNNIVTTSDVNIPNLPDSEISYNLSTSDKFGTANGNQANIDENNLFIGSDQSSTDGQYQLKENSPAKGAGENGVDMGAFGGPDPYVLSGVPQSIPVIYELNVSGYSNDENKLPVNLKAKSH